MRDVDVHGQSSAFRSKLLVADDLIQLRKARPTFQGHRRSSHCANAVRRVVKAVNVVC